MTGNQMEEDLHDITTHGAAWSRILNTASSLVRTRDEAFDLKAASVELQKRAEAFQAALRDGADVDETLRRADHFLDLSPRIQKSIATMIASLRESDLAQTGDIAWLEHEQGALTGLMARRDAIRDRLTEDRLAEPCPQF